jgi:hypothetical protein
VHVTDPRVSFEEAITDPKLLKSHFATLSRPQGTALKAFYGLPLTPEELDDWAIFQDAAVFDSLGYPLKVARIPYHPKEYETLVAIFGRRSGKTDKITATILAYEAALGGHQAYVAKGQDFQIFFVGQDLKMAASHLKFVAGALNSSPLLAKYVDKIIDDGIYLKNGLTIVPQPPTIKSSRGMAIPVVVMDEVGFWYTDAKSANPDFEVEIAVEYAQNQFPNAKKIITSTPWTKEGLLWRYYNVGTDGVKIRCDECKRQGKWRCPHKEDEKQEHLDALVLHAPTAAMGNPHITRKRLTTLQRKRPDAFRRESMAEFVDSISGFLPSALVGDAIDQKVTAREVYPRKGHPEDDTPYYVAAMDPAFRQDSFAFTILHHDPKRGMVQDRFIQWTPTLGAPLNPIVVLDQINLILKEFGITLVYSDQYQLESLQQLAADRGFTILGCDFTGQSKAKIFGSLEMLVKQRRIRLLDDPSLYQQLVQLEKRKTPNGTIQISAPAGKHDDGPAVLALAVFQATWMLTPTRQKAIPIPTHVEEGMANILKHQLEQHTDED